MTGKPWQGRFKGKTCDILEKFSESISFDKELFPQDIRGSIAHARMLGEKGIMLRSGVMKILDLEIKVVQVVFSIVLRLVNQREIRVVKHYFGERTKRVLWQ